jgi:hypothetical protein
MRGATLGGRASNQSASAPHGSDHTHEKVELDAISLLESRGQHFRADARNPHLAVWLVGEGVVHVVRELTVNADRLQSMQHRVT